MDTKPSLLCRFAPKERGLGTRQWLYTVVYSQCFSPCGKYMAASTNFGQIAIFSLSAALSAEAAEEAKLPVFTFKAFNHGGIFSLVSTESLLIGSGESIILAWTWDDLRAKNSKVKWSLTIPKDIGALTDAEVNALAVNKPEDGDATRLFSGCGNNKIYSWDLNSGNLVATFAGHEDFIHDLALKNSGRELVSASEDGTVRIWDSRCSKDVIHVLEPYKEEICTRPDIGKWISCVDVDQGSDWLVCGGGPKLSLWHLRSLKSTVAFDTPGVTQNYARFYDDSIVSAGTESVINHWFMNGDVKAQVPCTPPAVFHIGINDSVRNKVISVAGSSPKIDIFINPGYKAFSLSFAVNRQLPAYS